MEDCYICYNKINSTEFKILSCQHKLCNSCYLQLNKNTCPFCRTIFNYNTDDTAKRQDINYNNNTSLQLSENNLFIEDSFIYLDAVESIYVPNARLRRKKNSANKFYYHRL